MGSVVEIRGAKSFEVNKFLSLLDGFDKTYPEIEKYKLLIKARYPYFPSDHIRVAVSDNEILSGVLIVPEFIRLGEARLKVGVLGKIFTSKFSSKKGLGGRLIRDSVAYLERQRFNLALAFGVSRFYQRFGFAPVFFDYYLDIQCRKKYLRIYEPEPIYRVRRIKPSDIPMIHKIHDVLDEDTYASLLRTHLHYSLKWHEFKNSWVVYDAMGKIHGYFCAGFEWKQIMVIKEFGCVDKKSITAIVYFLLKLADKFGCKIIRFLSPPNYVLFEWIEELGIEIKKISGSRFPIGMAKLLNLEETFESLTPEWEKILFESPLRHEDIEITFIVDSKALTVYSRKGNISVFNKMGKNKITLDMDNLVNLVLGLESGEDLISTTYFGVSENARELIKTIFPKRFPYVWYLDRL